jgi:hypothetical protein
MNHANMLCKVMNKILIFATNQNNFSEEDFALKTSFSRTRKISFLKIVSTLLSSFNSSYNIEAFNISGGVSASSLCDSRYKIKSSVFSKISTHLIKTIINEPLLNKRFKGKYRVLAVDGTTSLLPDNQSIRKSFGTGKNQHKDYPMAQVAHMVDVLNDWIIGGLIVPYKTAETEAAYNLIFNQDALQNTEGFTEIYTLDKLYGSTALFYELQKKEKYFIIPLKKVFSSIVTEFEQSSATSCLVELSLSGRAMSDLKKKKYEVSKETRLKLRLVKGIDSTGDPVTLITNIIDNQEISDDDIRGLYGLRWGVETAFDRIKNILRLAHYSGNTPEAIKQDFHRKICLYNLSILLLSVSNLSIQEKEKLEQNNASEEILENEKKRISQLPQNKQLKEQTTRQIANFVVCKDLAIMAIEEFAEHGTINIDSAQKYIKIGARYSMSNKPKRSFKRVFKAIFIRGRIVYYSNFKMNS